LFLFFVSNAFPDDKLLLLKVLLLLLNAKETKMKLYFHASRCFFCLLFASASSFPLLSFAAFIALLPSFLCLCSQHARHQQRLDRNKKPAEDCDCEKMIETIFESIYWLRPASALHKQTPHILKAFQK